VNRKPPELPNIEDATLRACLAPLMDAMNAGADPVTREIPDVTAPTGHSAEVPAGSNDNPQPSAAARNGEYSGTPATLAEWRLLADSDFGMFRTIELFLAMTDAELASAAAEFPNQIGGTVARIAGIKRRLAAQYDAVTTILALLDRAIIRTSGMKDTQVPSARD
jgi:hypothetical protein